MGDAGAVANIRTISADAACHGPKGDFETRIVSARNGNLSFQQFFPEHKNISGILDGRAWQADDQGRVESMDAGETQALRDHEFQMMALQLKSRFHDFRTIGDTQFEKQDATQVVMTDPLGHEAAAYFSRINYLPLALVVTNPRGEGARTITIRFDDWERIDGVLLVSHVTILYGSDTWVFGFYSLDVNAADEEAFRVPAGVK